MQAKFSYTEKDRDKLLNLIENNVEDPAVREEMTNLLYKLINWNGKDKRTAGEIAKDYNMPVGEIGCKNCGITQTGAILENKCAMCGHPLIEDYE